MSKELGTISFLDAVEILEIKLMDWSREKEMEDACADLLLLLRVIKDVKNRVIKKLFFGLVVELVAKPTQEIMEVTDETDSIFKPDQH